jgi:hypothetical protein
MVHCCFFQTRKPCRHHLIVIIILITGPNGRERPALGSNFWPKPETFQPCTASTGHTGDPHPLISSLRQQRHSDTPEPEDLSSHLWSCTTARQPPPQPPFNNNNSTNKFHNTRRTRLRLSTPLASAHRSACPACHPT